MPGMRPGRPAGRAARRPDRLAAWTVNCLRPCRLRRGRASPIRRAWDLQRRLHDRRVAGEIPDTCLLLEHQPVYTAGRRTEPLDRPLADPGIPVIDVDRGGKITWHGPGQLVGYPIVALGEPLDVVAYVRALEEALIRPAPTSGVATTGSKAAAACGSPGAAGAGPQGRRDRHPGGPRGHHARLRAQLRLRPRLVRQDRALRHQGRGVTSLSAETVPGDRRRIWAWWIAISPAFSAPPAGTASRAPTLASAHGRHRPGGGWHRRLTASPGCFGSWVGQ